MGSSLLHMREPGSLRATADVGGVAQAGPEAGSPARRQDRPPNGHVALHEIQEGCACKDKRAAYAR